MRHRLFNFESIVAKTDFRKETQTDLVKQQFDDLLNLLKMHAEHEEKEHISLLKKKGSKLYDLILSEHHEQDILLEELNNCLVQLKTTNGQDTRKQMGYEFYLSYTNFISQYLLHLIHEERVIMPELWGLYSDDELRELTFSTYREMSVGDMEEMLKSLFPYINTCEKEVFLKDIKEGTPEKFEEVWSLVSPTLDSSEKDFITKELNLI
jgi:hypothetical protein